MTTFAGIVAWDVWECAIANTHAYPKFGHLEPIAPAWRGQTSGGNLPNGGPCGGGGGDKHARAQM
eukprot:8050311-Lingulodinium_polyedra.AAC.1